MILRSGKSHKTSVLRHHDTTKAKYWSYIQLRIQITPFGIFKLLLYITVFYFCNNDSILNLENMQIRNDRFFLFLVQYFE